MAPSGRTARKKNESINCVRSFIARENTTPLLPGRTRSCPPQSAHGGLNDAQVEKVRAPIPDAVGGASRAYGRLQRAAGHDVSLSLRPLRLDGRLDLRRDRPVL